VIEEPRRRPASGVARPAGLSHTCRVPTCEQDLRRRLSPARSGAAIRQYPRKLQQVRGSWQAQGRPLPTVPMIGQERVSGVVVPWSGTVMPLFLRDRLIGVDTKRAQRTALTESLTGLRSATPLKTFVSRRSRALRPSALNSFEVKACNLATETKSIRRRWTPSTRDG
jgi:hypothetical protein